jgi:hypothetical protein
VGRVVARVAWFALIGGLLSGTGAVVGVSMAQQIGPGPGASPCDAPPGPGGRGAPILGAPPASLVAPYAVLRRAPGPQDALPDGSVLHMAFDRYYPALVRLAATRRGNSYFLAIGYPPVPATPAGCPPRPAPTGSDQPTLCFIFRVPPSGGSVLCSKLDRVPDGHQFVLSTFTDPAHVAVIGLVPDGVRRVVVSYPHGQTIHARVRNNVFIQAGIPAQRRGPDLRLSTPGHDESSHNQMALRRYVRATTPHRILWLDRHGRVLRRFHRQRPAHLPAPAPAPAPS